MSLQALEQSVLSLPSTSVNTQQGIYSFHEDGDASVRLLCVKEEPRFFTVHHSKGTLYTGDVAISPVSTFIELNSLGHVVVDNQFLVDGCVNIHNSLQLTSTGKIVVTSHGQLILHEESILQLSDHLNIEIQEGGQFQILGNIQLDVSQVVDFKKINGIMIDTSAVFQVQNLSISGRLDSITDLAAELGQKEVPANTIGAHTTREGKVTYLGTTPDDITADQCIRLDVQQGAAVLGDFKLSILGYPKHDIGNKTIFTSMTVHRHARLMITDHLVPEGSAKEVPYLYPELYIGRQYNNSLTPGIVDIHGLVTVRGRDASITLDNGGAIVIGEEGSLVLTENSRMVVGHNPMSPILTINGTLMIDFISQLVNFHPENFRFGPKGKVIIRNPTTGVLYSISTKEQMQEYDLFKDHMDQVVYHIPYGCGIKIDEYHDYYAKDMADWWAGLRLEEAIVKEMIIWHAGAFIALDIHTTPWVKDADLQKLAHLFYAEETDETQYLQSVVDRLISHNVSGIEFRIMDGSKQIQNVSLVLSPLTALTLHSYPQQGAYRINVNQEGDLFLRNQIAQPTEENLMHPQAEHHILTEGNNDFEIR